MYKINDVMFTEEAWLDWDQLPRNVKRTVERKLLNMIDHGGVIPSLQAHVVQFTEDQYWIGYITTGRSAYRILFTVDYCDVLLVHHLLTHDQMERVLRHIINSA